MEVVGAWVILGVWQCRLWDDVTSRELSLAGSCLHLGQGIEVFNRGMAMELASFCELDTNKSHLGMKLNVTKECN